MLQLKSKTADIRGKFSRVVDKFFQKLTKKMKHKRFRMVQLYLWMKIFDRRFYSIKLLALNNKILLYRADFTIWLSPNSKYEEGISEARLRPFPLEKLRDAV